ncbi:MAG: Smr/MutS family protein [Flavobacteriaceae bacterium]|nr:DNA mismatch repair protein MutS [Bacteroidia bacterium]MBT8288156.1 DNA mismatch repair protein MutS [Bacteroidia bacterium]NNF74626.1 Smr/MutS family protein [Flavobacteriaceae bacterium]
MSFKIGDKVAVLDDVLEGVVLKIEENRITIESSDGFPMVFDASQLIRIPDSKLLDHNVLSGYDKDQSDVKPGKSIPKKKPKIKEGPIFEVDLHIHQLLPNTKGMTKHDIRTYQIDTARKQLEFAIRKRIPRMVFIHGVGEGVLKVELDYLLGRYDNITFSEASYQKYGLGATEVRIHQNAKRR